MKLTKRHIEVLGGLIGHAQDQHHDTFDYDYLAETYGTSASELDAVNAALAELLDGVVVREEDLAGRDENGDFVLRTGEQQPYITLDEGAIEWIILDGKGTELWRGTSRDEAEIALGEVTP